MTENTEINKKYYFISDLHFGYSKINQEEIKYKALTVLSDEIIKNRGELFILGDLFDYWFEYGEAVQSSSIKVLSQLNRLIDNKIKITYLLGNHDFAHLDFMNKHFGIRMIENELVLKINNFQFYLHHGDGFNRKDFGYLFIKAILRRKIFQRIYSIIHPDIGISVARFFSKLSRKYHKDKPEKSYDHVYKFARKIIEQGNDYVIFGHTHKREIFKILNGYYVNLGSWFNKPCYGIFVNNEFKIIDIENEE